MELDKRNQSLFEHLLANARYSIKDLAEILKITKAGVIKRLRFLENNGYIMRYDAIINWQKLPFIKKVYFIKSNIPEKDLEKELTSQTPVFSLISQHGLYNYQIWCFFKTKKQSLEFEKILRNFDYESIDVNELVFPRVSFFDMPIKFPSQRFEEKKVSLSQIDISIMKHMANGHGRESFFEMSRKLKIPYDSVHYHAKNILNSGYFMAIIAQPGTNKLTLQTTCLLIKCKTRKSAENLYTKLKSIKHILSDAIGKENKV